MTPKLVPLPDCGDLISMAEWLANVECAAFVPYDGSGHWATQDGMDQSSDVWSSQPPEWATHVMWFNK